MDNFDLKKFLIENKLTKNAKLLNEAIEDEEFFIELEDYLVNKALDTSKVNADQKNAWPETHIKIT
jgi:hypothetical protein